MKIKWKLYGQNGKIYQYSFQINVKFYSVIQIQIMFFRTDSGCLEITTFSLNCDDFTFFLWNFFSISNGNWNFHIFFFISIWQFCLCRQFRCKYILSMELIKATKKTAKMPATRRKGRTNTPAKKIETKKLVNCLLRIKLFTYSISLIWLYLV